MEDGSECDSDWNDPARTGLCPKARIHAGKVSRHNATQYHARTQFPLNNQPDACGNIDLGGWKADLYGRHIAERKVLLQSCQIQLYSAATEGDHRIHAPETSEARPKL